MISFICYSMSQEDEMKMKRMSVQQSRDQCQHMELPQCQGLFDAIVENNVEAITAQSNGQ